jgi:hypothetical protein
MKTHKFRDLMKERHTPEEIARVEAAASQELLEMDLREMRKLAGKTQVDAAAAADMQQSEVSLLERRNDYLLSTVRRYVAALGGELEVIARFGDKTVRLRSVKP